MKTIISALLALTVLAGVAAGPASAAGGYDTGGGLDVGQSSPL